MDVKQGTLRIFVTNVSESFFVKSLQIEYYFHVFDVIK